MVARELILGLLSGSSYASFMISDDSCSMAFGLACKMNSELDDFK